MDSTTYLACLQQQQQQQQQQQLYIQAQQFQLFHHSQQQQQLHLRHIVPHQYLQSLPEHATQSVVGPDMASIMTTMANAQPSATWNSSALPYLPTCACGGGEGDGGRTLDQLQRLTLSLSNTAHQLDRVLQRQAGATVSAVPVQEPSDDKSPPPGCMSEGQTLEPVSNEKSPDLSRSPDADDNVQLRESLKQILIKLNESSAKNETLQREKSTLAANNKVLEQANAVLQQENQVLQQGTVTLKEQVRTLQQTEVSLQQHQVTLQEGMEVLERENQSLQSASERNGARVAVEYIDQITVLKAKCAELEVNVSQSHETLTNLEVSHRTTIHELVSKQKVELIQRDAHLSTITSTMKQALKEAQRVNDEREHALKSSQHDIATLKSELRQSASALSVAQRRIAELVTEREEAEEDETSGSPERTEALVPTARACSDCKKLRTKLNARGRKMDEHLATILQLRNTIKTTTPTTTSAPSTKVVNRKNKFVSKSVPNTYEARECQDLVSVLHTPAASLERKDVPMVEQLRALKARVETMRRGVLFFILAHFQARDAFIRFAEKSEVRAQLLEAGLRQYQAMLEQQFPGSLAQHPNVLGVEPGPRDFDFVREFMGEQGLLRQHNIQLQKRLDREQEKIILDRHAHRRHIDAIACAIKIVWEGILTWACDLSPVERYHTEQVLSTCAEVCNLPADFDIHRTRMTTPSASSAPTTNSSSSVPGRIQREPPSTDAVAHLVDEKLLQRIVSEYESAQQNKQDA